MPLLAINFVVQAINFASNGIRVLVEAVNARSGAGDANKLLAADADGYLSNSFIREELRPSSKDYETSVALAVGFTGVNVYDDAGTDKVRKSSMTSSRPFRGFVYLNAPAAIGDTVTVYKEGKALYPDDDLETGDAVFLGATDGEVTKTFPPLVSGQITQIIGYASSSGEINIDPEPEYYYP